MRKVEFSTIAWAHFGWWVANDLKMLKRIFKLIDSISKDPHHGIGKPEPLKANFQGFWSRRIDEEHRIVYMVTEESIIIFHLKGHY